MLSGYSSGVYQLALEQQKGTLQIKPEKIICSADPLTKQMAEVIHQAFGIRPFNCYAATESIGMAVECGNHDGLHMFNDWHIFEVLGSDGKTVRPGESGFVAGLEKLQVIQAERNRLQLKVIISGNIQAVIERIKKRMEQILKSNELSDTVQYEIDQVQEIPNDPKTGKFKLILPI